MNAGWRDEAACRDRDPRLFYDERQAFVALAVCSVCPVVEECLSEAVLNDERGVWGGMTERQRRGSRRQRLRRRRAA